MNTTVHAKYMVLGDVEAFDTTVSAYLIEIDLKMTLKINLFRAKHTHTKFADVICTRILHIVTFFAILTVVRTTVPDTTVFVHIKDVKQTPIVVFCPHQACQSKTHCCICQNFPGECKYNGEKHPCVCLSHGPQFCMKSNEYLHDCTCRKTGSISCKSKSTRCKCICDKITHSDEYSSLIFGSTSCKSYIHRCLCSINPQYCKDELHTCYICKGHCSVEREIVTINSANFCACGSCYKTFNEVTKSLNQSYPVSRSSFLSLISYWQSHEPEHRKLKCYESLSLIDTDFKTTYIKLGEKFCELYSGFTPDLFKMILSFVSTVLIESEPESESEQYTTYQVTTTPEHDPFFNKFLFLSQNNLLQEKR